MSQFLVVYDRARGMLLEEVREFADDARHEALSERAAAERRYLDSAFPVEIVLLGAKSRGDLEKTHRRYFRRLSELVRPA